MGSHVALVKGNLHMGFQVDRATHILWDLRLTEKERQEDKFVFLYKAYYSKHREFLLCKHLLLPNF